jgi:hypothetical protein
MLYEDLIKKWQGVIDHENLPKIADPYRRSSLAQVLENTEAAMKDSDSVGLSQYMLTEGGVPQNHTGAGINNFDPVLISLVRRAMPNLIAYDICGVQPMTGPTGLIFAIRSRYANQAGDETFFNEVNTAFSTVSGGANTLGDKNVGTLPGNTTVTSNLASQGVYNYAGAMSTAQAEALGTTSNVAFSEMAFSIEKVSVTAKSRALKSEYTMEIAQDLKAIHGLDVEAELSRILTTETLAEINREVVRTIYVTAVQGSQQTTTAGIYDLDTDSNGRWSVEKFKGLMFHLETECNQIAKESRRGKGNIMICTSNVASALRMAGVLSYTPALNSNNLQVDDTGNTFVGVLNGQIKVYIDPYAIGGEFAVLGYKGSNAFDAGLFYCPYVPLQMVRAVDQDSFQPKIAFKTRYGIVANPFAQGLTQGLGALVKDSNVYYRRSIITNLL